LKEIAPETSGVAFPSASLASVHLLTQIKFGKTQQPCCVVCKQVAFNTVGEKHRTQLKEHYNPKSIVLYFKEKRGPPKAVSCYVFQLGSSPVFVRDTALDEIIEVKSDRPMVCKLRVSLYNHADQKDFAKLKDTFAKEAATARSFQMAAAVRSSTQACRQTTSSVTSKYRFTRALCSLPRNSSWRP
jgi:hypothetical protein